MQNTREYVCRGIRFGTDSSGVCVCDFLLSSAGEVHLVQLEGSDVMILSVPVLEPDTAQRWIYSPTSLKSKNKTQQSDCDRLLYHTLLSCKTNWVLYLPSSPLSQE